MTQQPVTLQLTRLRGQRREGSASGDPGVARSAQAPVPHSGLPHHSDQGSPYASEDYQTILEAQGITCSMGRRGNCYDNAVTESFFSTVKGDSRIDSRVSGWRRWNCSTTSRYSTTRAGGTRRWGRLVQ